LLLKKEALIASNYSNKPGRKNREKQLSVFSCQYSV
jgi:hypothetical protein